MFGRQTGIAGTKGQRRRFLKSRDHLAWGWPAAGTQRVLPGARVFKGRDGRLDA